MTRRCAAMRGRGWRTRVGLVVAVTCIVASHATAELADGSRAATGPVVGELAPELALTPLRFYDFRLDEREITRRNAWELYEPVRIADFRGKRPVALIFGSNAPALRAELPALEQLHREYSDRVQFLFVYIREAAHGERRVAETQLQRVRLANSFAGDVELAMPCLVDGMDDAALRAYAAHPARLYLVGIGGRIAFAGAPASDRLDADAFAGAPASDRLDADALAAALSALSARSGEPRQ